MAVTQQARPPYRKPMRITNSNGVSAGGTTTFDLPIGFKYLDFQLKYSGVTLAQLVIRHKINGEVIREYTGTERDEMNQFDGIAAANGVLLDPLNRWNMKTRDGEEMTGINTGSADRNGRYISKYTIEVEIAAAATAPALELQADVDDAAPGGPGLIPRLLKFPYDLKAGTERAIRDIPKGGVKFANVRTIYIKAATAGITRLRVDLDQKNHFERFDDVNRFMQTNARRNPLAGWYVIDRTERGYAGDPFNMMGVADFGLIMDIGTSQDNCPVFMDYVGGL